MKKYLKGLVTLGILAGLTAGSCTTAFAMPGVIGQWELAGQRWKYKLPDGSYLKNKESGESAPLFAAFFLYPDSDMLLYFVDDLSPYFSDDNPLDHTGWRCDENGWWYVENGACLKDQWKQSGDYWFYFGPDGYLLWDTTTPDGYQVNGQGRWTVDGVEQTPRLVYDQIPGFLEYAQHYDDLMRADVLAKYGAEIYDAFYADQPFHTALYDLDRNELDWMMAHPDAQISDLRGSTN